MVTTIIHKRVKIIELMGIAPSISKQSGSISWPAWAIPQSRLSSKPMLSTNGPGNRQHSINGLESTVLNLLSEIGVLRKKIEFRH